MTAPRDLQSALTRTVDDVLAFVRTHDPDAGAELAELRRRRLTRPSVVVVGETKRGKSSLVNALLGVPGLSPVDAAVATATYLHFSPGPALGARAYVPGGGDPVELDARQLAAWATGRALPADGRGPRRIEVTHPAPLLQYVTLLDTPGVGGLDPAHTAVALDAVERATALLFVADASAPLSQPELQFLARAGERVDLVVFALSKVDAYPGWRRIAEDNRALLRAHAPRFAAAPWFPVSARLAEQALSLPPAEQAPLVEASHIAALQHALVELAGHGHQLQLANVLRAARAELGRLEQAARSRVDAAEADPAGTARARAERSALAARKRTESRQWALLLNTETQRARVEAVGQLRTRISALQQDFAGRIESRRGAELAALPDELDTELHALAVTASEDLRDTFRQIGERVLAQVFDAGELDGLLTRLNATLRHSLDTRAPRDGSGDNMLIALSAGGIAVMAGRGVLFGASVAGVGGAVFGGLLIPVAGLGLGLAAGGYVLYRRRVQTDRQQARTWLRDVLAEARAALTDEISFRFTDLQYALGVAVDDAVERRLRDLDAHIAEIDAAAATDAAGRQKRRAAATAELQRLRDKARQADDVLTRARALAPASAPIPQEMR
ncbi:dynamin family protein [Symbioplanes lichenis]|uniref:dynamin family protein n=1 Tax=Symbioplanes lichenis TaxID=1629072 RepID=UPI0027390963|nr:dynamin family protein [Actinoplanes lichenis]